MSRDERGFTEHTERRQASCDPVNGRLYTDEERQFLVACDAFRRHHRRIFLAACDYLTVLVSLGYHRG